MSTLTLEPPLQLPAELVLTRDAVPAGAPAAWLPAALEALQTFRQLD